MDNVISSQDAFVGVGLQPASLTAITLAEHSRFTLTRNTRSADTTTAGNRGASYALIIPDPSGTVEAPLATFGGLELVGLVEGRVIPWLYFWSLPPTWNEVTGQVLTLGRADLLRGTYIESLERTAATGEDVQRVRVTFKGGRVFRDVVPAFVPNLPPQSVLAPLLP